MKNNLSDANEMQFEKMKCKLKKNEMHFEKKEVQFEKIKCNLKNMKCNLKKMKCDLNKMKCQIILVLFSYYLKQKNPFIANFENNSLVSEYLFLKSRYLFTYHGYYSLQDCWKCGFITRVS